MRRVMEEDYQFGSCCFAGRKRKMEVSDLACVLLVGYSLGIAVRYRSEGGNPPSRLVWIVRWSFRNERGALSRQRDRGGTGGEADIT